MKKTVLIILLLAFSFGFSQTQKPSTDEIRISKIKNQLEILSESNAGLKENIKTQISLNGIQLSIFLLAVANVHDLNINVSPELNNISIAKNFPNVTVLDLLVFLCKEYNLTIIFTENILSIKRYEKPIQNLEDKIIPITYISNSDRISIDAKEDNLYHLFKQIMDKSGNNLVFSPGLENKKITIYIQDTPFDIAMNKLAFANDLHVEKTKDDFYLFEDNSVVVSASSNTNQQSQRPARRRNSNFFYKVLNPEQKLLEVDLVNTPIADIVNDISSELKIDVFTATPLEEAGVVTFKTKSITFDELLIKIFEAQFITSIKNNEGNQNNNNNNNNSSATQAAAFTFKKEGNTYFFGTENQLSVRKVEVIHLLHRSIKLLADPTGGNSNKNSFNNQNSFTTYGNNNNQPNRNREQPNTNSRQNFGDYNKSMALLNIVPEEVKQGLDIKVDYELNSFYVTGPSENIKRFKQFIEQIDKSVPVILIELMIIQVNKSSTVETGISWGIGESPANTQGSIFPSTNITIGAQTINRVIGGFDGFGSFNLGKVVPNFYATIKAMETNGDLEVRSTPKISTLNGHRANFSNGQTSFYAVTQRNIIGSDNPQTNEITNYVPIEAELGITIKPFVSGDGQVTLDIFVIQSSFGQRIAEDAPPDINSREFSSIIRVQNQDIVVLGGLEEDIKNDSGSGVPLLSRIPVIKWLFSTRKREDKKTKLTVLIKPTIFY